MSPGAAETLPGLVKFFTRVAARKSGSKTSMADVTTCVKKYSPSVVWRIVAEMALLPI